MSLRDYFASAALTGLLANAKFNWKFAPDHTPEENVARRCYAVADAMLAERRLREPTPSGGTKDV